MAAQKLSELKKKVIPTAEVDDPLIVDPPYAKTYVEQANKKYAQAVEQAVQQRKAAEEAALRKEIEMAEKARTINAALKL